MTQSKRPGEALAGLLGAPNPPLDHALLLFSEFIWQQPDLAEQGLHTMDALANELSATTTDEPSPSTLVRGLFGELGFSGDVENYHDEDNSFLDRVIRRRVGMPITLAVVAVAVGQRLGIGLHLIGLPGHVVVGIANDREMFIDAFSGAMVDRAALEQRLRSIFQTNVEITNDMLAPMQPIDVITRISNNLLRSWSDEPKKIDQLLELNVLLPLERADQRRFIQLAEARGRFDVAAALREKIDPTDPTIATLWARLN